MPNTETKIQLVKDYIYHRKDKEVDISINNMIDIIKLEQAYHYAMQWFNLNKTN